MNYFRNNYGMRAMERVMLVIFAFLAVTGPVLTVALLRKEQKILLMDDAGNYHLLAGRNLRDAKALHIACVTTAATAFLSRTPEGYLFKESLFQAFTSNCTEYLQKAWDADRPEFELKKMRQLPEIKKIEVVDQGNGYYLGHVLAYLTRACEYEGFRDVETAEAILTFRLAANPDISLNGRLPLVVYQIERAEYRKIDGGRGGKKK